MPPCLKYVATVPCEILISEISDNPKCVVINDKLQDNRAAHLIYNGLFNDCFANELYHFIYGDRIFKVGEPLAKLPAK